MPQESPTDYSALFDDTPAEKAPDYSALFDDSPDDTIERDGVRIPKPRQDEAAAFDAWAKANDVHDPFHPDQHYDYVGAFRAGEGRAAGSDGHFTDRFKLPGHETFSNESQYARGDFARRAGHWDGDRFVPARPVTPLAVSAIEGAANGVPLTGYVDAAGRTALDVAGDLPNAMAGAPQIQRWGDIVNRFKAHMAEHKRRSAQANEDHPWVYGLANLGTAIGTGVATGEAVNAALGSRMAAPVLDSVKEGRIFTEALPAAQLQGARAAAQLAGGEVANQLQDTNTGRESAPFADQGVGALAAAAVKGVLRPVQALGKALQLPQRAQEAFFNLVGDTRLAKWLADGAETPEGKLLSDRVRALRENIASADAWEGEKPPVVETPDVETELPLPFRLGRAAAAGEASIDRGNVVVPPEFADDLAEITRTTKDAAAEKAWPGSSAESSPFLARADDAKTMAADASLLEAKRAQAAARNATIPRADISDADRPAWWDNRWRQTFEADAPTRVRPIVDATEDAEARRLEKLVDAEMGMDRMRERVDFGFDSRIERLQPEGSYPSDMDPAALRTEAGKLGAEVSQASRAANAGRNEAFADTFAEARMWRDKIAAVDREAAAVDAGNKFERERLAGLADSYRAELARITRGRAAATKALGAAGAMSGTVEGFKRGGLLGAGLGYEMGQFAGNRLFSAADNAGAVGQRLASGAAVVDRLAARNDALGRAAKWVLSAQGDAFAARLLTLMDTPEYQEAVGSAQ